MRTVKIWSDHASEGQLREIVNILDEGGIIIYPTDTVYAFGCDALNSRAIESICRLKGINPQKNNLAIICSSISQASEYARIDNRGFALLREYTPGPFTFLFKALGSLPREFKGRKTVGIRIPELKLDQEIVEALGRPLLTTSIPLTDEDYTQNPELIAEAWEGRVSMLIDGGLGGLELSTVIDCTGPEPQIIRQGKGQIEL